MTARQALDAAGRWALGCQARPWMLAWGETFTKRLPEVMAQIAAIGFTGFATRLDRLPLDDPDRFATVAALDYRGWLVAESEFPTLPTAEPGARRRSRSITGCTRLSTRPGSWARRGERWR